MEVLPDHVNSHLVLHIKIAKLFGHKFPSSKVTTHLHGSLDCSLLSSSPWIISNKLSTSGPPQGPPCFPRGNFAMGLTVQNSQFDWVCVFLCVPCLHCCYVLWSDTVLCCLVERYRPVLFCGVIPLCAVLWSDTVLCCLVEWYRPVLFCGVIPLCAMSCGLILFCAVWSLQSVSAWRCQYCSGCSQHWCLSPWRVSAAGGKCRAEEDLGRISSFYQSTMIKLLALVAKEQFEILCPLRSPIVVKMFTKWMLTSAPLHRVTSGYQTLSRVSRPPHFKTVPRLDLQTQIIKTSFASRFIPSVCFLPTDHFIVRCCVLHLTGCSVWLMVTDGPLYISPCF